VIAQVIAARIDNTALTQRRTASPGTAQRNRLSLVCANFTKHGAQSRLLWAAGVAVDPVRQPVEYRHRQRRTAGHHRAQHPLDCEMRFSAAQFDERHGAFITFQARICCDHQQPSHVHVRGEPTAGFVVAEALWCRREFEEDIPRHVSAGRARVLG
jgi:hypothetical protein